MCSNGAGSRGGLRDQPGPLTWIQNLSGRHSKYFDIQNLSQTHSDGLK